jgi:hypothetical protein
MNFKTLWATVPRAGRIAIAAAGAAAVAGTAVGVTAAATGAPLLAASPKPTTSASTGSAYCDRFVGHLSSDLGKSQDQVKKALTDALNQTLADAVKNGDLTQQQADAIKAKESGGQLCAGNVADLGKKPAGNGHAGQAGRVGLAEYAKALGISQATLQQDMASGKTVKDLAAAQGMDENAFRSKLVSVVKSDLDPQVTAGKLTQQQEDKIIQRLQTGPLPLWDRPAKRPRATASPAV